MICTCQVGEFCRTFNREMTPRQQQICAGEILPPKQAAVMRANWAELAKRAARPGPCTHLGAELRREQCPSCCGKVQLKVFSCAVLGECTPHMELAGVACCSSCGKYAARE